MIRHGFKSACFAVVVLSLLRANAVLAEGIAAATVLSGNVESQTLLRHSSAKEIQFVQNRNTFRLSGELDLLAAAKTMGTSNIPGISSARTTLLYRGVYDSVYDAAPGDRQHGQERYDDLVGGSIQNLSHARRDVYKFENDLREAYLDLSLSQWPIHFRFGRQQVVWGEADHFRLMDLWNPLDLRWHMHQETKWDEIRYPLWLLKAVWNPGRLGPINDFYTELVYNPGDYKPGIITGYLPRPWALPFPYPLRQGQVQYDPVTRAYFTPEIDLQGTSDAKGDFHRNPAHTSEVGVRMHGTSQQGIEATINYFWGRGRNIGAAFPFAMKIESIDLPALPGLGAQSVGRYQVHPYDLNSVAEVYPIHVRGKLMHPYMHVFGLTLKYFDAALTGTSFRMETAYVLGSPFQTIESEKLVQATLNGKKVPGLLPTAPLGFTKRDLWSGMIGFDRANMWESLNPEYPWLLSGQLFWTYTTGRHVDLLRGNAGVSEEPYFGPVGVWMTGPHAGQNERQQNARQIGNGDNIRRWESLFTLTATSSYHNGTLVPILANIFDPVNLNNTVIWSLEYFLTNSLFLTVQQAFYTDFKAKVPSNDPWFVGGRLHRRDETGLKVTWQF